MCVHLYVYSWPYQLLVNVFVHAILEFSKISSVRPTAVTEVYVPSILKKTKMLEVFDFKKKTKIKYT